MTCGRSVVSFTNKTDSHDIAEILLKVALNTMTLTLKHHSTNVGFLITVTMLELILRKRKIIIEKNNNKVQILIRKIINAILTSPPSFTLLTTERVIHSV